MSRIFYHTRPLFLKESNQTVAGYRNALSQRDFAQWARENRANHQKAAEEDQSKLRLKEITIAKHCKNRAVALTNLAPAWRRAVYHESANRTNLVR